MKILRMHISSQILFLLTIDFLQYLRVNKITMASGPTIANNITIVAHFSDLQQLLKDLKIPILKGWSNIIVYVLFLAIIGFIYKEYLAPRVIAIIKWFFQTLKSLLVGIIKALKWLAENFIYILPYAVIGFILLWILDLTFGWNLLNRLKNNVEIFVSHLEKTFSSVFRTILSWKDFEL